jgi:hypothetical protein
MIPTHVLLVVLALLAVAFPVWPWSQRFGWYPVIAAGMTLVFIEILYLLRW